MTKFTPGPWRHATTGNMSNCVEGPSGKKLYDSDDGFRTVAMVQSCTALNKMSEADENCAANIALIAAAPDLYAALRDLVFAVRKMERARDTLKGDFHVYLDGVELAAGNARGALRKAGWEDE